MKRLLRQDAGGQSIVSIQYITKKQVQLRLVVCVLKQLVF